MIECPDCERYRRLFEEKDAPYVQCVVCRNKPKVYTIERVVVDEGIRERSHGDWEDDL